MSFPKEKKVAKKVTLLNYFQYAEQQPCQRAFAENWGSLLDCKYRLLFEADPNLQDVEWKIKVEACLSKIQRGCLYSVHFQSTLSDDLDWSRCPGSGVYDLDELRYAGFGTMRMEASLSSICSKNLKFILTHTCLNEGKQLLSKIDSEVELHILASCLYNKHTWLSLGSKYWFPSGGDSLVSALDSLIKKGQLIDYRSYFKASMNLSEESAFTRLVDLLVSLSKDELAIIYKELCSKSVVSSWTKVRIITGICSNLSSAKSKRKCTISQSSFGRFLVACESLNPNPVYIVRLDDEVYKVLARSQELFFLSLGVSPAEAAAILRIDLASKFFVLGAYESLHISTLSLSDLDDIGPLLERHERLRVAVACGDQEKAYEIIHNASNICLEGWKGHSSLFIDDCVKSLTYSLIFSGVQLLERQKQYELAVHYLRILVDKYVERRFLLHHVKAVLRLARDLEHIGTSSTTEEALCVLETLLKAKGKVIDEHTSQNALGGLGASVIRMLFRLSVPPRRWNIRVPNLRQLREAEAMTIYSSALDKRKRISQVEQVALDHFESTGWKGYHTENGTILTLFGLLLWDAVLPKSKSLSSVLDIPISGLYGSWSESEKSSLECIVKRIMEGEAETIIRTNHATNFRKYMRGVNWSRDSLDDLVRLAKSFCSYALGKMISQIAMNYMAWCNGLPDLLLWKNGAVKFVEVKGPGDSLSDRQRAWIDFMLSVGINVSICYVKEERQVGGEA